MNNDIESLIASGAKEGALNAAVKPLLDYFGIKDGGYAEVFFSDKQRRGPGFDAWSQAWPNLAEDTRHYALKSIMDFQWASGDLAFEVRMQLVNGAGRSLGRADVCTFREFLESNDTLTQEEIADIYETTLEGKTYYLGGGAAARFKITRVESKPKSGVSAAAATVDALRDENARLIAAAPETAAERDQLLVALETANDTNAQLRLRNDSLERMVAGLEATEREKELLAVLKAVSPDVRGWVGVVRRSHGHHSQQSAAADARYHKLRAAIAKAEGRV